CQHFFFFFFSSRRRHTRFSRDWSSDVCSSDLTLTVLLAGQGLELGRRDGDRIIRIDNGCPLVPDINGQPGRGRERHGGGVAADRSEERRVGKECRARGAS